MKTYKNLFPRIVAFSSLLSAYYQAARGKRERDYVLAFTWNLEDNLQALQVELKQQSYCPGKYRTFHICYPKPRLISAAPFRDRVVHHALMNVIGPLLEQSFIFDSYANRIGKGTHKAIRRYQCFLRQYGYVLKSDIKKYFPSIDHEILKSLLRRRIADPPTLWLLDTIIDHSNPQLPVIDYFPGDSLLTPAERRKGLPIGNLTSQFFANFYLDLFDHFIKETLHCTAYLRYVDDFVLFSDSKQQLQQWRKEIEIYLEKLRLRLNPKRVQLYPSRVGTGFLGQVVYRAYRRVEGKNLRRFRRNLRQWEINPPENLTQRIASWAGHARQADSGALLRSFENPEIKRLISGHNDTNNIS